MIATGTELSSGHRAAIVTVGDELLTGDIANTNGRWLARELESLGFRVELIACLPDDRPTIAEFVRWAKSTHEIVLLTGGLGGTPDDVTRDALAAAFAVERLRDTELAAELKLRGGHSAVFASEWSRLPEGSRVLRGAPEGAPAFVVENVYALAGVPAEMRATFETLRDNLRVGKARRKWQRRYAATEDEIAPLLNAFIRRYPSVVAGCYPRFPRRTKAYVELILRASSARTLSTAGSWLESALSELGVESLSEAVTDDID